MLDTAIINGTVVTPDGPAPLDIGIVDGRISQLAEPGGLPEAAETIDAAGLVVVPGGIDPHIHCDLTAEGVTSFGPDVVGRAALIGGTTTLIDFVWKEQDETIAEGIARTEQRWIDVSPIDYSFHVVLRGIIDDATLDEIPATIEAGFPSFKVFTTNVFPHEPIGGQQLKVDFGSFQQLLETTGANGGIAVVHAEDDDIVQHQYRRFTAAGDTHFSNLHLVHNSISEDLSFRRVIRLAAQVGNAPVYFMHVSAKTGVDAMAEARRDGQPVFGETLHQYALHTFHDYLEHDGMKYHTYPSLKDHEDAERLWSGIADGTLSSFATDGQATSYADKTRNTRIDDVVGGNAGIEPRIALIYTEMVDKRGLGLDAFVRATSSNAAKVLGLYPAKGAIAVGSDADLVGLRTGVSETITADKLHESDYTPWEGWSVSAWPAFTLLRGAVVARDNEFVGDPTGGARVARAIDPAIATGPRFV
jgi:dihydropyrimidinase